DREALAGKLQRERAQYDKLAMTATKWGKSGGPGSSCLLHSPVDGSRVCEANVKRFNILRPWGPNIEKST
ncbi:MAG: hypothetical protein ACKPKO_02550, partial [Candidatus Fonsibacter sp.]